LPDGELTRLQIRVLHCLADMKPRFTLTGGGALVAVHLKHRETRDLDLFWQGRSVLDDIPGRAVQALESHGFDVTSLKRSPNFASYRLALGGDVVVLDLVADPTSVVEAPKVMDIEGVAIQVDTPHEILVNKLCTLLGRAEIRDLVDVRSLLAAGGDLERAVADAPTKDGGFSPLMLGKILDGLPLRRIAASANTPEGEIAQLEAFRRELVDRLTGLAP
jgi:predicted nucleotidyltransferase